MAAVAMSLNSYSKEIRSDLMTTPLIIEKPIIMEQLVKSAFSNYVFIDLSNSNKVHNTDLKKDIMLNEVMSGNDLAVCADNATLIVTSCGRRECYSVRQGLTGSLGFDSLHAGEWTKPSAEQGVARARFLESRYCD